MDRKCRTSGEKQHPFGGLQWFLMSFAVIALGMVVTAGRTDGGSEMEGQDSICVALFKEYVERGVRVYEGDLLAASQIIASRGRTSGFWKHILAELRRGDSRTEVACVRILGRMLEGDAQAREVLRIKKERPNEIGAMVSVCVGDEVVKELISRASEVERDSVRYYMIALAASRAHEAKHLFSQVLADDKRPQYDTTAKFYSAIALSQLGDEIGVVWLIEHLQDRTGSVFSAWPEGTLSRNVSDCCQVALRRISGRSELRTASEWTHWWSSSKNDFKPVRTIRIISVL